MLVAIPLALAILAAPPKRDLYRGYAWRLREGGVAANEHDAQAIGNTLWECGAQGAYLQRRAAFGRRVGRLWLMTMAPPALDARGREAKTSYLAFSAETGDLVYVSEAREPGAAELSQVRVGAAPVVEGKPGFFRSSGPIASDRERAARIGQALWDAGLWPETHWKVHDCERVGEAWLVTACQVPEDDAFDPCAYFAFDARNGGLFIASRYNPPPKSDILQWLRVHRGEIAPPKARVPQAASPRSKSRPGKK